VTADLFVEAVGTAYRLFYAGAAWLLLTAAAATLALYAVIAILWSIVRWVWKTARRRRDGPSWALRRSDARKYARTRLRAPRARTAPRVPKWAHTQPIEHEWDEAA